MLHWFSDSLIHWFIGSAVVHGLVLSFMSFQWHFNNNVFIRWCTSQLQQLQHLHCFCISKTFHSATSFLCFFLESFAVALGTICFTRYKGSHYGMDIKSHRASKNGGYPQIIQFYRTFPEINHPANLGYPHDEQETSMYGVLTLAQIGKSAILSVNHWWFGGNSLIYFSGHFRNRLIGGTYHT